MGSIKELLDQDGIEQHQSSTAAPNVVEPKKTQEMIVDPVVETKNGPSSEVLLPLLEQWIDKGAKAGAYNIQAGYLIYLSLRLLHKEPHSSIVNGNNMTRAVAAENLNVACNAIQAKGGIFKSVEQGAQVYETVLMMKSIIAKEEQSADASNEGVARTYSEQDLIPDTLRLRPEVEIKVLIGVLEETTRKGFEIGALTLDKSTALASALRLLKQNPGDVMTTGGDNPVLLMDRMKAFHILVECVEAVTLNAKMYSLQDHVLLWPTLTRINAYLANETKEGGAGGAQPATQEDVSTNANKKRKSSIE